MTVIETSIDNINSMLFKHFGHKVQGGPFKGMFISKEVAWTDGNIGLKLLGLYEHELHPYIAKIIESKPRNIVNVGCAEGYYAVGLAYVLPEANVIAMDINPDGLKLCRRNAIQNHVEQRIHYLDRFDLTKTDFIFTDCEGCELELFTDSVMEKLTHCNLIVECHVLEDVGHDLEILTERFQKTHDVIPVYFDKQTHTVLLPDTTIKVQEGRSNGGAWLVAKRKEN